MSTIAKPPMVAQRPAVKAEERAEPTVAASPLVASAFSAGIAYVWVEAILRLIYTYFPDVPNTYMLWPARVGDIGAMWLTMTAVALLVFYGLAYLAFRGKQKVGTITGWTLLFTASAIIAPLVGEIGTSWGV